MKIAFTEHAKYQMGERDIREAQVINTLAHPMQVVKIESGHFVAQRVFKRNGREMLLRVFFERKGKTYLTITAYWTSKIDKYFPRRKYESTI